VDAWASPERPRRQARGGTPEASVDVADRARRLFDFLAAAQRLRLAPVRTVDAYERDGDVFWLGELRAVGTALAQEAPDTAAPLLVVRRVQAHEPPAPPPHVVPWLDGEYADPERLPTLRASRLVVRPGGPVDGETAWLENYPDVETAYDSWRPMWGDWAAKELLDRPVRALYKELFAAYTAATRQPEELELVLGSAAWHGRPRTMTAYAGTCSRRRRRSPSTGRQVRWRSLLSRFSTL
jgi:hypothetical protein